MQKNETVGEEVATVGVILLQPMLTMNQCLEINTIFPIAISIHSNACHIIANNLQC
jgi:hypothetical protein